MALKKTDCCHLPIKSSSTTPSSDSLQLILSGLDAMQGCLTALKTCNSSTSTHGVNVAEAALVRKERSKDKPSSRTPFATPEEDDYSVANEDIP